MSNAFQVNLKPILALLLLVVFVSFVVAIEAILMPFLLGALFAYLGDPVADRLEALGLNRTLSVTICFVVLLLAMLGVFLLVLPMLFQQIKVAYAHVPQVLSWVQEMLFPWLIQTFQLDPDVFDVTRLRNELWQQWSDNQGMLASFLAQVSAKTGSFILLLTNLALVPVVSFYLLRDWDILIAKLHGLLPLRFQSQAGKLGQECTEVVGAFLRGQLWVMAALAIIYTLGLWMLGLKLALLVGLLAGLASVVPYMGFVVGIFAAGVAGFLQFGFEWQLLVIGLVFLIGQVIESVLLTPILVGDKIGLHPVAVIFAVLAGGQLFGFIGILLALPVAAVIMVLLRHIHEIYKDTEFYSET